MPFFYMHCYAKKKMDEWEEIRKGEKIFKTSVIA